MYAAYECYSEAGDLLYVGVTENLRTRITAHKSSSKWYPQVTTMRARFYATAAQAAEREVELLATAAPIHNKDKKGTNTATWVRQHDPHYEARWGCTYKGTWIPQARLPGMPKP
jgi:predicted GIY-YIG superfamily endonuclease